MILQVSIISNLSLIISDITLLTYSTLADIRVDIPYKDNFRVRSDGGIEVGMVCCISKKVLIYGDRLSIRSKNVSF